ncbi:hypothetical protein ACOSQ3_022478 [Xanthoceras sorbifolium]
MIVFISIGFLLYIHQIWSYKIVSGQACSPSDVIGEISLRSFSYNQLVVGTDDFKKAIGREGSGRVYKGCLGANNAGKEIAVKSLEKLVVDDEEDLDIEEVEKMVKIGLFYVKTELVLRPTMKTLILMMEGNCFNTTSTSILF